MTNIFNRNLLLETMYETDKQFLASSDDAIVKKQLDDALETIQSIPDNFDSSVSLDSVRIFSDKNEKFYIEMDEVIRIQEEFNKKDIVEALKEIIDFYSTKAPITLDNTFVIIRQLDLDKIKNTIDLQKSALMYIKFLRDAGINLVKK